MHDIEWQHALAIAAFSGPLLCLDQVGFAHHLAEAVGPNKADSYIDL